MERFCKDLNEHATKIINYEKKEMIPSTYRGAAHRACKLRYKTPKEISITFHNGSTCDYHFIIKKLAKKFEG